jgi:hypothetical protein
MRRTFTTMAAIAALALGVAACGGDDDEEETGVAPPPPPAETEAAPPEPVAQIDTLTGRNTRVTLDSGFVEALGSLELTPAPVGGATINEEGIAEFPITDGNVTYYEPGTISPFVQGLIEHNGSGLSLESADGTLVELTDFEVDPGASVLTGTVSVDGEEAVPSAPLFFLDGSTLEPLRTGADGAVAVLEGTTVELKAEAADLLNETFGVDALEEGMTIGEAKITVDTGA